VERVTAMTMALRAPLEASRRYLAVAAFGLAGLIDIVLGLVAHAGDAGFALSQAGAGVQIPTIRLPAAAVCYALGAISVVLAGVRATVTLQRRDIRISIAVVLACFVVSLLCWADAGAIPLSVINLGQGTLTATIPLILGALAGCLCERSGVINIAIEGQLLLGAFTAAVVASAVGVLWLGLISGSLAGGLVGAMLALFAIRWLVDQIILGVVINLLISGLTGYLYDRLLVPDANTYNSANTFSAIKIPGLGNIPILGPIFFDSTIFLYITYAAMIAAYVM
jgi:ABC-type uncharacterized transport system permease subunit